MPLNYRMESTHERASASAAQPRMLKLLLVYLALISIAAVYSLVQARSAILLASSTRIGCVNFHHDLARAHAMHEHDIASLRAAVSIRQMTID